MHDGQAGVLRRLGEALRPARASVHLLRVQPFQRTFQTHPMRVLRTKFQG